MTLKATCILLISKLQLKGHVYFQLFRPKFIITALNWLKDDNPLYKDIQIDCGNIDVQLTDMTHNENDDTTVCKKLSTSKPFKQYSIYFSHMTLTLYLFQIR